jgi:hypothetical protein
MIMHEECEFCKRWRFSASSAPKKAVDDNRPSLLFFMPGMFPAEIFRRFEAGHI